VIFAKTVVWYGAGRLCLIDSGLVASGMCVHVFDLSGHNDLLAMTDMLAA